MAEWLAEAQQLCGADQSQSIAWESGRGWRFGLNQLSGWGQPRPPAGKRNSASGDCDARLSIAAFHLQRLAASFRSLAAETQHLTRPYERKLAALEELKKSLLHQAFNGEP